MKNYEILQYFQVNPKKFKQGKYTFKISTYTINIIIVLSNS